MKGIAVVVSLSATLAACSGGSTSGASSCAGGPVLRLPNHKSIRIASCAGEIGLAGPGPVISLKLGQQATLSGLNYGYSAPVSDDAQVVEVRPTGNTAALRAVGPGATTISLATDYCMGRSSGHCPAIKVTVQRG